RGAAGGVFIITRRSRSPPTPFWSPSAAFFPPTELEAHRDSRCLAYPAVTDPAEPPLRPERHNPTSIATVRRRLTAALAKQVPRCPCCHRGNNTARGPSG